MNKNDRIVVVFESEDWEILDTFVGVVVDAVKSRCSAAVQVLGRQSAKQRRQVTLTGADDKVVGVLSRVDVPAVVDIRVKA